MILILAIVFGASFVATLISLKINLSELRAANWCYAKHHRMDVVTEANLPLFSSYKVSTVLKHPAYGGDAL